MLLLAAALAAAAPPPFDPSFNMSCGGRSYIRLFQSFSRRADAGNAGALGALFDDKALWQIHGRALAGPEQITPFFRELHRSARTIDIQGNYGIWPSVNGLSVTGPYVERRTSQPEDSIPPGIYEMELRCKGHSWKIERLVTPQGE